ncbi:heparinase II/III domain-containing protein [Cellulomonas fengjieae]|uniref:Heparinase II/III family protein n=1 Tax=Cellulomonas fengjieae TaxID=2819978 RepID=A0ABS3SCG0_9CELL|nr:heparinase II/III family protein [Cellulomonas fengjieae]MBO3083430.1 heparinase II/III family protein [Cellulomonas fengjieae]QVI65236.1 heparinase II/III family protein [Cellulomonas fengjieae]
MPTTVLPGTTRGGLPLRVDRVAWAAVDDRGLVARAQAERGTPWPQPLASQYARFRRDGDRVEYEDRVFGREDRLTRAVVTALVTDEPAWLDEVADGVTLLCEQSSWCWPAHDDAARALGAVVPVVTEPVLDLGAGEVAARLAWIDHALGDRLDVRVPGVRRRLRHEVRARVLDPFVARDDWGWLAPPLSNWTAWIHANVLTAALALLDGSERDAVVARAADGLAAYLESLPADGAIDEGYSYWWQGACRALEALDLLEHATGIDAAALPVVRATVGYPHAMHLGGRWYLAVGDGTATPPTDLPWHVLHAWALRTGSTAAAEHAAAEHVRADLPVRGGIGRTLQALAYDAWPAQTPSAPLPARTWFPSTQVALLRQTAGSTRGLAVALKGGHNAESHNHNDLGSVVVAVDGVPVVVDPGRPTYTAQTFGPDRYALWTMQSSWHSVPEVRGTPQRDGAQHRATDAHVSEDGTRARLDLTAAYPTEELSRWTRTVTLDRVASTVRVEDDWDVTPEGSGTVVHWVLAGEVDASEPGRVVVHPLDGARRTRLTWDPAGVTSSLTVRTLDDPMLSDVWGDHLTRLELRVDDAAGHGSLTVTVEADR